MFNLKLIFNYINLVFRTIYYHIRNLVFGDDLILRPVDGNVAHMFIDYQSAVLLIEVVHAHLRLFKSYPLINHS